MEAQPHLTFLQRWDRKLHLTYAGLERLFQKQADPWHFASSLYERNRFAKMLKLMHCVPHARILEVGCAEGHFTQHLLRLSSAVTAIDLSAEAIERAKCRAPGAQFFTSTLEDFRVENERYDVVVCGEMLYYVDDIDAAVNKLRQLGRYLVTSTCFPSALRINAKLARYRLLDRVIHVRVREFKATSIRLWEL
jgi:2-polyprenyl-3-methyl-5-hydroxy-6-metoxy-1,4-benzoquinol methylase